MSIVVYWLEPDGRAGHEALGASQLVDALRLAEQRRAQGMRHVCLSSELPDSVGAPGVDAVEGGRLPDGHRYEFDKRHRGAGPRPKDR